MNIWLANETLLLLNQNNCLMSSDPQSNGMFMTVENLTKILQLHFVDRFQFYCSVF